MAMIERAFARNLRAYVDGYRALDAPGDVDMMDAAGGVAAFLGVGSPLTTVKGAPADVTSELISELEDFFRTHRVPTITMELAPWANPATNDLLAARGYEVTSSEDVVRRIVGRE